VAKLPSGNQLLEYLSSLDCYKDIYWNNIFRIEDKYINEEDIDNIVNSFGSFDNNLKRRVVLDLMLKFDCLYYKNLNIKKLYGIIDEMNEDDFRDIFKPMFKSYYKQHEYDFYYRKETRPLFPINDLMSNFKNIASQDSHFELFKISIYIYGFSPSEVEDFWIEYFKSNPKNAINTLSEMNNHKNDFVNKNIKNILSSLVMERDLCDKDTYDALKELNDINIYQAPEMPISNILEQILGDLYGDL